MMGKALRYKLTKILYKSMWLANLKQFFAGMRNGGSVLVVLMASIWLIERALNQPIFRKFPIY